MLEALKQHPEAGEADGATLRQMVELGWGHSPMRDSIEHGVTVAPTLTVA